MYSLLLAIIYVAFISLGLPDSLLGAGWPAMYTTLGVPVSYAGIISMIIAGCTIISSLLSDRLTARFGAGLVTAVSVGMTAAALFGFSLSGSFILLCLWAIPYGLGAGSVDAALNNYVALHYSSRQMSWLHCFWGIGVTISPYIMSFCLTKNLGWNKGYLSVSIIQIVLTAFLFISLPLWKKRKTETDQSGEIQKPIGIKNALKIKGVPYVLLTFFGYCALETTAGLWAATYFAEYKGICAETSARFASLFFIGITVGRFLNGFIADKFGDKIMIRTGILIVILGTLMLALPINYEYAALIGLLVIGLGCAPIYPCVIHSTPNNFGEKNSQAIIGIQMASAYVGSTLMPPVFGFLAERTTIGLYPFYLLVFALLMIIMSEKLNRIIGK
ncbi:MAG: MFS transporter [Acutalibacteraceae bacterium]|nr:MFS transporter [Acutalibacteraceae bacterium]